VSLFTSIIYILIGSLFCILLLFVAFILLDRFGETIFLALRIIREDSSQKKKLDAEKTLIPSTSIEHSVDAKLLVSKGYHLVPHLMLQRREWNSLFFRFSPRFLGPRVITAEQLGLIEKHISQFGLEQVIVLADRVDEPHASLREAVLNNFSERVQYLFLISQRNADQELKGYYQTFLELARKSIQEHDRLIEVDDLVKIYKLPYDWDDFPAIFYRLKPDNQRATSTWAFRGLETNQGIASHYEPIPGWSARMIARAVMTDAPRRLRDTRDKTILMDDLYTDVPSKIEDLSELTVH
jgi:hypothetical protein